MPRSGPRTGLSRLTQYLEGRWGWVTVLVLATGAQAAAQSGGWLIVREAINRGIVGDDAHFLTLMVIAYAAASPASARRSCSACAATSSTI